MSFLDRFRNKQPPMSPRGASGRMNWSGYLELEELNADLTFPYGLRVFDKMYRTDPDVRRNIWMVANPIIGATWSVEPYGGDEAEEKDLEAKAFVEWALFEQMRPRFKGHLAQALPVGMRSGFCPFEQVWHRTQWEGRDVLAPKSLGLRLPRTIQRFIQEDEDLVRLEQLVPQKGVVPLPAEDLIYYRWGAEGDNWEGISLLRAAYKPWLLKDKLERIDAIKQERQATGIPTVYPPTNAQPEQLDAMGELLGGIRTGEQTFLIMPGPHAENSENGQGWRIEILSPKQAETSDVQPSLQYHTDKIAAAFLAEFMRLGQGTTTVGARATADVQQNPFLSAVEAVAGELEGVLNEQLVARMVALNFDVDEPPSLSMSLVDSTSLTELAGYVKKLVDGGAMHADPELEDFLRSRADLPPADAEARAARIEATKNAPPPPPPGAPPPPAPPKPGEPPAPAEARDRELRWWEQLMELEAIETAINGARTQFQEGAGDEARAMALEMARTALAGRKARAKPPADLTQALLGELEDLYSTGRATVRRELAAQGAGVSPDSTAGRALAALRRRAQLAAESIAHRVWQTVSRAVLAKGSDPAAVQAAAEAEAAAGLRAEAQLHAAAALNLGRDDEGDAHADVLAGARYTSILDTNRCHECATADDDVLRPLDDPVRIARKPPNHLCYGGDRCRCMEFFQLKEEAPGYGGSAPAEPPGPEPAPGTSPVDHFEISGGSAPLRQLVADQVGVVGEVHDMPANVPRVPIKITPMAPGTYGRWRARLNVQAREIVDEEISLSRQALAADPPITSTVHEIGHHLDGHGFGAGPPDAIAWRASKYYSSTPAMAEWRAAALGSVAYRELVAGGGTTYTTSTSEVFARSYEQWIALRSGDSVLAAKIAARRAEDDRNLYWDAGDFAPIAQAFDRFFASRGLIG